MSQNRADIFAHPDSNIFEEFSAVVVLDDDAMLCRMMCESLADRFRNTVVLGFIHPETSLPVINQLYFDIVISDINMPGLWGDKIIAQVKNISPTTFTAAMTGFSIETAYAAGKAQPDFFFDKNKGMDPLWPALEKGFKTAKERRERIFSTYLDESLTAFSKPHWRERGELKQHLGFSLTEYFRSIRTIKAMALLKLKKNMTQEELAIISGHSSSQYLKENLKEISRHITLPDL